MKKDESSRLLVHYSGLEENDKVASELISLVSEGINTFHSAVSEGCWERQ